MKAFVKSFSIQVMISLFWSLRLPLNSLVDVFSSFVHHFRVCFFFGFNVSCFVLVFLMVISCFDILYLHLFYLILLYFIYAKPILTWFNDHSIEPMILWSMLFHVGFSSFFWLFLLIDKIVSSLSFIPISFISFIQFHSFRSFRWFCWFHSFHPI